MVNSVAKLTPLDVLVFVALVFGFSLDFYWVSDPSLEHLGFFLANMLPKVTKKLDSIPKLLIPVWRYSSRTLVFFSLLSLTNSEDPKIFGAKKITQNLSVLYSYINKDSAYQITQNT